MSIHEIVLPETTPETEWIAGRPLQKVSPTGLHGILQRRFASALGTWADEGDRGRVGTEWRFRIAPPGEIVRPLVPDVAYVAFARLGRDASRDDIDRPLVPPTAALEILSPDDRLADVLDKIVTYRRAGTDVVIVVDPERDVVVAYDACGAHETPSGAIFTHAALPGFALDVAETFRRARR